jgi:hypothetical protein
MFLPEKMASDFFVGLFSNKVNHSFWIDTLNYIFSVIVITFIHPFYISANFALYINRRTQLEAWDLELDFRKLAMRLGSLSHYAASLLIIVFISGTFLTFTSAVSYADEAQESLATSSEDIEPTEFLANNRRPANDSKTVIKETTLTKNLNDQQTITYWVKKKTPKIKKEKGDFSFADFLEPFAKLIGFIIEFGLWVLLGIGVLLAIYFRDSWLHLFNLKKKQKIEEYEAPEVMFGMDVRPDSLPDDIIGEARKLWQDNKNRESLSLLYRGALVRLINQESIKLQNSYTEGDVLDHAKSHLDANKLSFLEILTRHWKLIAYAHRIPLDEEINKLFELWPLEFAVDNSVADNSVKGKHV